MKLPSRRAVIFIILTVVGIALGFIIRGEFYVHLLILCCIWMMLTMSYNLLMGYTGLLSLGQSAYMGIGAYASVLLCMKLNVPWPVGMLGAIVISGLVASLIGLPATKLRPAYFAMITFGFGEVVRLVITNWDGLTQGPFGIVGVPPMFESIRWTYVFVFAMMVVVFFVAYRLIHSRMGRAFIAIREDEPVAESLGINIARYTLLIYVISAMICGLGGAILTHYLQYCYPGLAQFWYSAYMLIYTVVGGPGLFVGPAIAAFIFTILPELFRFVGEYFPLMYGLVLVSVIVFLPRGLEPVFRSLFSRAATSIKSAMGRA